MVFCYLMLVQLPKTLLPLLMTIVGGTLLPAQFSINSALKDQLHSVTLTAAISYSVGAIFLWLLLMVQRQKPDWAAARRGPLWMWLGGAVGSAYVVGSVVLTQALGAATTTTLVIASQVVMAILLDHFGALGLPKRRINSARLIAVGLAFAALGLRFWGSR
jgi:transporter family-2 protein